MNSMSDTDTGRMKSFQSIAIIDDAFNPPVFGDLGREIQDLLADPSHPETDTLINLMVINGIIHEAEAGEISLGELQSSRTLVKLLAFLQKENPREAERLFGKYLADRMPLLDLRKRLEDRGILADSIFCAGPGELNDLDVLPDLIFLDLFLWEDLDEVNLIEGVVDLILRLNPPNRHYPLFVVLMSERDSILPKLADSLRDKAHLSINQFRFYPKQSLVNAGSLALPLLFETLQGLRGVAAAQAQLAESLDAALNACKGNVRSLILSMEDGDFRYLARQAADDHIDGADYLSELIGSYIEAELEGAGGVSREAAAYFNVEPTASGTPPAPHIASTKVVRELFVRARQRLVLPGGVRDSERPGAKEPAVVGQEWRDWLRRFLPPGLVVGPEPNEVPEGSRVYLHLSQDCDTLQEDNPQSELSLLFVPATVHNIDMRLEKSNDRIVHLLVRINGKDCILRINLRKFKALDVEEIYVLMTSQWYTLALLRRETADALRRRLANQLNRPAEPKIDEQRLDWQLTEVAIQIDSQAPIRNGPLAIPCMLIRGKKGTYLVQLPQNALIEVADLLEQQSISQLKGSEVISCLTGVLSVKTKKADENDEGVNRAECKLRIPLNQGLVRKVEIDLCFEERRSISYGDAC